MDNLAHTLAGLALAEAGLKRKTALGTVTLAVAANLPDLDAVSYLVSSGVDSLAVRRGWTHGVLAMVVLPVLLAAAMLAWDRRVREPKLRQRGRSRDRARAGWLLVLAVVGVWSHPLLDLLNTYGVRLLMPFSGRWFYGDTLFIVDPWLWLVLAAGVLAARWRGRRFTDGSRVAQRRVTRPARLAIAALVLYVAAMSASSRFGRVVVERQAATGPALRTMVAPVPLTPFRRQVVRDLGGRYELGELRWEPSAPWSRYRATALVPVGRDAPGAAEAARTPDGAKFLSWSRFPRFTSAPVAGGLLVRISDVRYADASGRGWATVDVLVPQP